ncbi:3-dehydroquinate synthase [Devriesea agamarum]|uniref:3-dehydroquinate synthase n=1 Tax=Devriesea agamarum TaxID=472569 RepID=UPI00071E6017|nr:3-dehydroquinate synthase [Devriesea agamarum]
MTSPQVLPVTIPVTTDTGGYEVRVGRGLLDPNWSGEGDRHPLLAAVPEHVRTIVIVHPPTLAERAAQLRELLSSSAAQASIPVSQSRTVFLAEVPDGEAAKTSQVAAFLWQVFGQADMTRSDLVIGFGGGATTDLAGFAAATWLRGIDVLQIPTTVAAVVDAAVGGKTGINTAEGKNLVGAFHTPIAVLADLDLLKTLPRHDIAAGLAEVVKGGFIADPTILDLIEADPEAALDVTSDVFAQVLVRKIRIKAEVVGQDLRESGLREILNYGHTLAHAIERCERYQWRHGAAVSIGMVFAAELAHLAGKLSEADVDRHRSVLISLGLPVTYRGDRWAQLEGAMRRDKKARGSMLRFVVLDAIGRPTRLEGPDPALLLAAYGAISS